MGVGSGVCGKEELTEKEQKDNREKWGLTTLGMKKEEIKIIIIRK